MAHKLKIKPVPHIRKDGKVGTKKDYVVRCKRRGKLCCEETFSTRTAAENYASEHWDFVNRRKAYISSLENEVRRTISSLSPGGNLIGVKVTIRPHRDPADFQMPSVRHAKHEVAA